MIVRTFDQEKVLEAKHALEMTKLMRQMEERQIELTACRAGEKGFSDELDYSREARTEVPQAVFVIVGRAPGTTLMKLRGDSAEADYEIRVQ